MKKLLFILFFLLLPVSVDAADFFVDQNFSGACSDDAAGTETEPWCTLGKMAEMISPGDTVTVKAGIYDGGLSLRSPHGGTSQDRITIKAASGDSVIIDGKGIYNYGFRVGVSYVTIDGFEVKDTLSHGILVGWSEGAGEKVEILNNDIHSCGGANKDTAAVYYSGGFGGLIEGNHLHDNAGDGITFFNDDMTIRNNQIHNNGVDGIKGSGGGVVLVENNTIHDMKSFQSHGDGMQMMGMVGTLIVRNNTVYNCTQNIFLDDYSSTAGAQPWGDAYVYNNLIYNAEWVDSTSPGLYNGIIGGASYNNWNSYHIYSNTLVDLNDGNGGIRAANSRDGKWTINTIRIHNNILYNSINSVSPTTIQEQGTDITMDNNFYYNDQRSWYFGDGWTTLSNFQVAHPGFEENSIEGELSFVNYDYTDPDFHLLQGSQAIDHGASLPDVNGISFASDYDGVTRPQARGWDIGAFEYISESTPSSFRSDVNNDSLTNSSDALLVLRKSIDLDMSATNWQSSETTGDANCDGLLDAKDALLILRYSLGLDMTSTPWCVN